LYLMNLAEVTDPPALEQALPRLLSHPALEVRLDVLSRIEKLKLVSARLAIRSLLESEKDIAIRATAIRVASIIDPDFMSNQTVHYMAFDALPIQIAAIRGVFHSGTPHAITMAEAHLQQLLRSKSPRDRTLAVQAVGEMNVQNSVPSVLPLLQDSDLNVRSAAIICAGKLQSSLLWSAVIENLSHNTMRPVAVSVLSSGDAGLWPVLADQLAEVRAGFASGTHRRRNFAGQLIRVARRLHDTDLLEAHIDFPDPSVRVQVLTALVKMKFQPLNPEPIAAQIHTEIQADIFYLQGLVVLKDDSLLSHILRYLLDRLRERVFLLCALIYDASAIERIRSDYYSDSEAKQSYALEMLHVTLAHELRLLVISLLDNDLDYHQGLDALVALFEQEALNCDQWLERVLTSESSPSWLKVMTLSGIRSRRQGEVPQAVQTATQDTNAVVRETAIWALENPLEEVQKRGRMLPTIEKILLLKSVNLFRHVPDPILFEIASIVKDETVPEGKVIIHKGDLGDFMYIIASGRVRIHDGDQTITYMGENAEFGELALLDSEPRSASVTAVEETYLLRLDQNTFYELISDYPDVLRGIIQVLSGRLRDTTRLAMTAGAAPLTNAP
ncbi:MAG: cyclic nucleotide-binding domain-containing protein, partial [Anaerolineae bacterium]|nr:cyclic nucleotide-binding domain-containing protein [Anaerolineae bacterium]